MYILGVPCGSAGKESAFSAGDLGSIPGSGRSPGEGNGNPLQYSGLVASPLRRVISTGTTKGPSLSYQGNTGTS